MDSLSRNSPDYPVSGLPTSPAGGGHVPDRSGWGDRIRLRRVRNVPEIINDSLALIRTNARLFLRSLFFLAFAPMLLSTGVGTYIFVRSMSSFADPYSSVAYGSAGMLSMVFSSFIMIPIALIGYAMLILVVHELVKMYDELSPEEMAAATVRDVWNRVQGQIWSTFGTVVVWGIGLSIACGLMLLIPFVGFFGVPVILVYTLLYFPLRIYDRRGLVQSFIVSSQMISGSWWKSLGLIILLYLLMVVVSGIFIFPITLYTMMNTIGLWSTAGFIENDALLIVLGILYVLLYTVTSFVTGACSLMVIIFHYFSQTELKEARSLEERISLLGVPHQPEPGR